MSTPDHARPRPHAAPASLPASTVEWILEAVALAALLAPATALFSAWPDLPNRVPRHFNAAGEPDAWAGRSFLWFQPAVTFGIYILMTLISRHPQWGSTPPVEVTPRNVEWVHAQIRSLAVWMKALICAILAYMSLQTLAVARGEAAGLGGLFMPLTLAGIAVVIGVHYWRMRKGDS